MTSISITLVLIVMTAFISYQAFQRPDIKQKLMFNPYAVKHRGEWHRFISHGFIHADWNHLILNMVMLYLFGSQLEYLFNYIFGNTFAPLGFVLMYLSAIVIAAVPDYYRHNDFMAYNSLGASGATSALLMAYVFFSPWGWFIFPPVPAIILAIGFLYYESYMDKKGGSGKAHNAHFWGAVYGIVFIFVSAQAFAPEWIRRFFLELMQGPGLPPFLS